eukprot:m.157796 g.157796  ORF g.157796 m.157796 type:complete len:118 (+) comp9814_c0_seq1:2-355(+)
MERPLQAAGLQPGVFPQLDLKGTVKLKISTQGEHQLILSTDNIHLLTCLCCSSAVSVSVEQCCVCVYVMCSMPTSCTLLCPAFFMSKYLTVTCFLALRDTLARPELPTCRTCRDCRC